MALSPDAHTYLPDLAARLEGHTGAELHRVVLYDQMTVLYAQMTVGYVPLCKVNWPRAT